MLLYLPLKSEYFDQIKSGSKTEEYRLANDYWSKRLEGCHYEGIVLTKGYPPKKGNGSHRIERPWRGCKRKTITHPHFGSDPVDVFAIRV